MPATSVALRRSLSRARPAPTVRDFHCSLFPPAEMGVSHFSRTAIRVSIQNLPGSGCLQLSRHDSEVYCPAVEDFPVKQDINALLRFPPLLFFSPAVNACPALTAIRQDADRLAEFLL